MTALSDLIARLEAAKEGNAALEAVIQQFDPTENRKLVIAPKYTRSIDAALTLKPGSCPWWRVGKVQDEHSPMRAFGHGKSFTAEIGLNWGDAPKLGYSDTAPLALCIAALRAREAAR